VRTRVLLALLLIFLPGIAFALVQLFVFQVEVRPRARLAAWIFLAAGVACAAALVALLARDALRRARGRGARPGA
jgi:hypothetical protein